MTITTAPVPVSFAGDDATVGFAIPWKYFAKSHVVATLRNASAAETTQVLDTDYTLTAADVESGGMLTMIIAPATGETLNISLVPPNTQASPIPLGGSFPSPVVEDALDRTAQRDARIEELWNRAIRVPITDTQTGANIELPIDTNRANRFLKFGANGEITTALVTNTALIGLVDNATEAALTLDASENAELQVAGARLSGNNSAAGAILNEAASSTNPTLVPSKADLDTGIGRVTTDQGALIAGGSAAFAWSATLLFAGTAAGAGLGNETSSVTNPTLFPRRSNLAAGIGGDSGGVSMIANSIERITADATGIGFFATTTAAQPTGVAVSAAGIHAALVTLGLITA